MTWVVGLTGGIGSGKSTVAHYFRQLKVPIIDTDELAREVVAPGKPAWQAIVNYFGETILNPDTTLHRRALRQRIFNNLEEKQWLEYLLHPQINRLLAQRINEIDSHSYCIAVIPLLIENYPHPLVKRILVVNTPSPLQIKRTMTRDHCSAHSVEQIIQQQIHAETRLLYADEVISNDGNKKKLADQVKQLHELYSTLSKNSL